MQHLNRTQQLDALFPGSWSRHTMSSLSEVIWPYTSGLYGKQYQRHNKLTPTGKPPPLAVRLEKALPFRR